MKSGLTNLDTLKKYILVGSLADETKFDDVIKSIGLGVAATFDTYCSRKFCYQENDTIIFTGDRDHYYLPRFPLVKIAKVELRYFQADAWNNISGQPLAQNSETGLLHFGYTLGANPIQVRVTYTGGYWFETAEPDDDSYPTAVPDAIINAQVNDNGGLEAEKYMLDESLKQAFLLQCAEVWRLRDKLGYDVVDEAKPRMREGHIDLLPLVQTMLQPFKRYQLT